VSFRRLLALRRPWLSDVQVQHIGVGVIVGAIEGHRADGDVHAFHVVGSFRVASAVMTRAGTYS
jgi:hypothetical protein